MENSGSHHNEENELYVVGVGASAGGLDAISKFLTSLNGVSADFCVVIVMHLSPDYKSELTSILSKRCRWPVVTVQKNTEMVSRHIYVTPQNCDLHVQGDDLILDSLHKDYIHAPSINNFFRSLADSKKAKAVGVILSGFGQDGSEGIIAINKQSGFTIAQLPETAEHRDMPKAAINTGHINVIIPAEQMFDEIVQYITNTHTISQSKPAKKSVDAIFELLEKRSGTDFSLYKPTTIMRRINHRMTNLQINSLVDYYTMIKKTPKELDILYETVLIGVTEFFRDKEAFNSLRKHLINILKDKKPGDNIRIWSVGCATGEEPYSIGILLHELLGTSINQYFIQIFASDIDERALNFARKGIYRKESLKNLDEHIINTYFTLKDEVYYELSKEIKQHTLFARQDISIDAPFVKLDVIVCRNLLIYFNNELQKQTLQIFHYSLRQRGLLFLGKSESVSLVPDLFHKSDANKMFFKTDASLNYELRFSRFKNQRANNEKESKGKTVGRNMSIAEAAKETLYYKFQHPFVIINDNAEIKEVHGSLRMYLEISQGTMNANLYKMANPELVTVLKGLKAQVKKTRVQHRSHVVKFELYGNDHYVQINIVPLVYSLQDAQYYIVIFEKIEPNKQVLELQKKLDTADFVDLRIKELEDELTTNKEHLQIFTEELEATNEELQTINEELQSANEELKSSNEELETSNEELQSANEELNTANYELRVTNEAYIEKEKELKEEKDISQRNEAIYKTISENIPNGTVGILNTEFEIEYLVGNGFTNQKELLGKKMPDLNTSESERKKLTEICKASLKGNHGSTEVLWEGKYYDIQTVPIKLPHSKDKKILYLALEVTSLKNSQLVLDTVLDASNLIVLKYNFQKDEIYPDKILSEFLEIPSNQPLSKKDLLNILHPDEVSIGKKSFKKSKKTGNIKHETRICLKSGIKHVRVTGKIQFNSQGKPDKAFATILDITEDKHLLERIKESEARFREIAEAAPITIWKADVDMNCTYINKYWLDFTGSTLEDNVGKGFLKYIHPDDQSELAEIYENAFQNMIPFSNEYRIKKADGSYRWFANQGVPITDSFNGFKGFIGSNVDVTDKKNFTKELEKQVSDRTKELKESNTELVKANINLEEYAYVASHDLQEPLRKIRMINSILVEQKEDWTEIENHSNKIESLAGRMADLIRGILVYGELSKDNAKIENVDLDLVVTNIKEDLEDLFIEKKVRIVAKDLGTIKGSTIYIHQLLTNLIRNGIKFNEEIPEIKIEKNLLKGDDLTERFGKVDYKEYNLIKVSDNGIGIKKENQELIFKPFKRLYSKSQFPGTGIGLAICKRIVDMHQGYIHVEKNSKDGSTFMIYLPVIE